MALDDNGPGGLPRSSPIDTEGKLRNQYLGRMVMALEALLASASGTFTLTAAATNTIPEPKTQSTSLIELTPLNASAATLMGSNKALYISSRTTGASFAVTTASGAAPASGEQFQYTLRNPV